MADLPLKRADTARRTENPIVRFFRRYGWGYAFVLPGRTNPEHRHMTCEEIIYMLSGELKVYAHGECTTLEPGQTALIPPGVRHTIVNDGWEPVTYLASFSAAFRDTIFKGQTGRLDAIEKLY